MLDTNYTKEGQTAEIIQLRDDITYHLEQIIIQSNLSVDCVNAMEHFRECVKVNANDVDTMVPGEVYFLTKKSVADFWLLDEWLHRNLYMCYAGDAHKMIIIKDEMYHTRPPVSNGGRASKFVSTLLNYVSAVSKMVANQTSPDEIMASVVARCVIQDCCEKIHRALHNAFDVPSCGLVCTRSNARNIDTTFQLMLSDFHASN